MLFRSQLMDADDASMSHWIASFACAMSSSPPAKMVVSSAHIATTVCVVSCCTWMRSMCMPLMVCLSMRDNGSMASAKRRGASGNPCLKLSIVHQRRRKPLTSTSCSLQVLSHSRKSPLDSFLKVNSCNDRILFPIRHASSLLGFYRSLNLGSSIMSTGFLNSCVKLK